MRQIGYRSFMLSLVVALCITSWIDLTPAQAGTMGASHTLVVIKRFGAALRTAPSSNATIVHTLTCGAEMHVVSAAGGWYKVLSSDSRFRGWVGGARVADTAAAPSYDCTDAYTFQVGEHGYSYVRTGCLSLRLTPSRQASYKHCVRNFHDYAVRNGPIAVAGEDWFGVYSPATGSGWVLAQYLLPYQRG